jgi:uncharacterized protein
MNAITRAASPFAWLAAAWLAFLVALPAAAAPTFPPLTGRVVDDAGILSENTKAELTSMLEQQDKQTGVQVVVVTLKSLQGYPIEDYGYQLGRYWKLGQKGKDNGALIEIAPNEHKIRIDVGYGLEGQLTDAQSKVIIDEIMTPAFKAGDINGGVVSGTAAVLKTIGGATITQGQEYSPPQNNERHHSGGGIPMLLIVFLFWIVFGRFLWPLLFLGGFGGGRGGFGGGGFGGGGFGGGGGGFSGGGGSFGGGGASGSW